MKKLLALVLALVMTLSLCVTSNAAFADAADIEHDEAVEVMYALGVINGKGDNKFDPKGNVTRAEMAKMITIIMLGDIDAAAFKGTTTDLTDTNGHWAEGFIKYCYSQGVIAGKGNGLFDPNANVTAAEAAKMLLVAIGYNAKVQGYTGADWAINVARDAQISGFYAELKGLTSGKVLTRDEAAQMIYNAVEANTITKVPTITVGTNEVSYTYHANGDPLLEETFGAVRKYGYLTGVTYNSTKETYTYTVTSNAAFGGDAISTTTEDGIGAAFQKDAKADYSALFGQKVAVVYDTDAKNATPIFGIYSEADVLVESTMGKITKIAGDTDSFKVDDVVYDTDVAYDADDATNDDEVLYVFNNSTAIVNEEILANSVADYTKFAAIDNDDDGKVDILVVKTPVNIGKVTYAGTASLTVKSLAGVSTSYDYDKEKDVYTTSGSTVKYVFPKVAKNDYVVIGEGWVTGTKCNVSVLETLEGKVVASGTKKLSVDGTWYPSVVGADLNSTYKFQVFNGYLVDSKVIESASKDLLYVIAHSVGTNNLTNAKAKVMFADGTKETIEVTKLDATTAAASINPTDDQLYTYAKNSDGTYTLKTVSATNKAGFDAFVAQGTLDNFIASTSTTYAQLSTETTANTGTYYGIDDEAVVFVKSGTTPYTYSVITGKSLKTYATKTLTNVNALLSTSNGISTVGAATLCTSDKYFGVDSVYAYITSAITQTSEDNTPYANYTAWTVNGEVEVKDTRSAATKGDIVTLKNNTDGSYTSTLLGARGGATTDGTYMEQVAVIGYSESDGTITLAQADGKVLGAVAYKLPTTAKYLYVNTKSVAGVEGGEIALAEKLEGANYVMNAYAVYTTKNSNGTFDALKALVVDVNNNLFLDTDSDGVDEIGNAGFAIADATVTNTTAVKGVTAKVATSVAYDVANGQVVTYTVTLTGNATANTTVTLALTGDAVDGNATCVGAGVTSTSNTATVTTGKGDGATIEWTVTTPVANITAATVTLS